MTTRDTLVVCIRVRLRKQGVKPQEVTREMIWEVLDDSRPGNAHIVRMRDELGYGEDMTNRQTRGLIRDVLAEWY